jgi:pimeloyl-ACP methyl ester carboxylesterase
MVALPETRQAGILFAPPPARGAGFVNTGLNFGTYGMNARIVLGLVLTCLIGAGCSGMKGGDLSKVQVDSDRARAGNAYLVRGLIGVFSTGMDELAAQLEAAGIRAHVYQSEQRGDLARRLIEVYRNAPAPEPLILIGHSYGADDVIRTARDLDRAGIPVDLIVTVDATTPPRVPKNVKLVWNFYQSSPATDWWPMFRGIPLELEKDAKVTLHNIDIRDPKYADEMLEPGTNHVNIDKNAKLQRVVVQRVVENTPTREQWTSIRAQRSSGAVRAKVSESTGSIR